MQDLLRQWWTGYPMNHRRVQARSHEAFRPTKIPREHTQRDTKRAKMEGGRREKSAKFWASHPAGPISSGPHFFLRSAPTLVAPLLGAPPFGTPPHLGLGPTLWGHDTHQTQKWIGQKWIGQNWSNQDGQNGIGQSRSTEGKHFLYGKNEGLSVSRNNHRKYPAWRERHRQPQVRWCRAGRKQNCEQQCMRGDIATGEATLPGRCAATGEEQTWLSPLQVTPRKCVPRRTIAYRLPRRGQRAWFCHLHQTILGMCALSVAWSRVRADTRVVSMASCAPPCCGNPSATTSSLRLSMRCGGHRSKSRTIPGTHARLHSRVAVQAARWWPRLSRGRAHRQLRERRGRWTRRSIKNAERLGVKSRRLGGWERHGVVEKGPNWYLNNALFSTGREGINTFSRKSSCKLSAASFCQPKRGWVRSSSDDTSPRSQTFSQLFPRGRVETVQTESCFTDRHEVVRWVVRDDASQDGPADLRVTLVHHVNTIRPTNCSSKLRASPTRRCATRGHHLWQRHTPWNLRGRHSITLVTRESFIG